jgi:hypothetical protein
MRKSIVALAAAVFAALVVSSGEAETLPLNTPIYVGSGVYDSGSGAGNGAATSFHCTNVSGVSANLRFLLLGPAGNTLGSFNRSLAHANTVTASTHETNTYFDYIIMTPGVSIIQGGIVIESTQTGVFCTAITLDAGASTPNGFPLNLIRFNPHPGSVE